jgi:hypothetical protein
MSGGRVEVKTHAWCIACAGGVFMKDLWIRFLGFHRDPREPLRLEENSGTILRPGGHAEPAEAGGAASVWYQSHFLSVYFRQREAEEKKITLIHIKWYQSLILYLYIAEKREAKKKDRVLKLCGDCCRCTTTNRQSGRL